MSESLIEEIHRVRRDISDRFDGDINRIADDAAERLAKSGRPVWQPKPVTMAEPSETDAMPPATMQPSSAG